MIPQSKPWLLAAAIPAAVAVVQALLAVWFAWPAQNTAPHDLPIVVAGPPQATTMLVSKLRAAGKDTFDLAVKPDAKAADAALRNRDAYAAFIVTPAGLTVHLASAASPTVATLVTQAAQTLASAQDQPGGRPQKINVVDVVGTPRDDPRGTGFVAGFLPILITSIGCGLVLLFAIASRPARVTGLIIFAASAGALLAGLLHLRGILTGPYLPAAGAIALLTLAISAAVSGLGSVLGYPGVLLGAVTIFFLGNPISGLTAAPELLPAPWGSVGQLLPPGAGASLLRSAAFFDGAKASQPLLVLAVWALCGLALTGFGQFRNGKRTLAEPVPDLA